MRKRTIIIIIFISCVIAFGVYQVFFKKEKPAFTLAEVSRGDIFQEISETGIVSRGEEINLTFKNAGRIEKIYVKVGDLVESGQELARLETTQLSIQLVEAKANTEAQKAKLTELQKGTSAEEIKISRNLLDKAKAELDNLYKDTLTILNEDYNLADNGIRQRIAELFLYRAEATIPYYELTYKYCDSQAGSDATAQRKISENELNLWQSELQNLNDNQNVLDEALIKAEEHLKMFQNFLNRLNDTLTTDCELSSEDISKINTYKSAANLSLTDINTALSSVYSQRKAIEAQKIIVQNYQEELNLKLAGATLEQIAYQEAQVKQAEAKVALLEIQFEEATLKSPTEGEITKTNKREGEMVQPVLAESIISLLPLKPFQIKVDIYEEDIVNINIDHSVDITLVAFPNRKFNGKVISINPAEKLIEGIVYYETTIDLESPPQEIKPGMTADISIKKILKANVLVIPEAAIERKNGKSIVLVLKGKTFEEREVEIGVEGSDEMVEVISGLKEGETVAIE